MDYSIGSKSFTFRFFSVLLTLGLFSSFSLHSVQIPHAHPSDGKHSSGHEHSGGKISLDEYMHLADKKLLSLLSEGQSIPLWFLLTALFAWFALLQFAERVYTVLLRKSFLYDSMYDYLRIHLRKGIIHTKIFELSAKFF